MTRQRVIGLIQLLIVKKKDFTRPTHLDLSLVSDENSYSAGFWLIIAAWTTHHAIFHTQRKIRPLNRYLYPDRL